ncbi:acyl-CoA dehydrogenase [Gulosibacter sp. 10]|uniref:acyl-CoA dehydrogenase family protein n=1 Tax=Gulosibacter sp. 10 TaxID=1255570 RepID=UPI0020CE6C68|nr:acyl-CoA dehydrogenase [Gulosibacter sp. 10]
MDIEKVHRAILGTWAEERQRSRKIVEDPAMWRDDILAMPEHRERTLEQLKLLAEKGTPRLSFPKHLGGGENPGGNIAAFEELFLADPSLQIKSGVQFGLFGAAIMHLGTEPHHDRLLPGVMSVDIPGAFAMTETGHGSDVSSIGTTATYDAETEEFVIHTPFRGAWKDYLGNAALHGRAAVVFAQLITKGMNHGVHAFYVDLRDEHGEFLPGVGGEDDGVKGGLNGIDNGRLHFTNVRIPRENLLNRYGDVAPDGTYSSPIESPGRRFFVMLGTLVQGRVSLDGSAAVAQQAALAIAITYGNQRRQFDNTGSGRETMLLDYGRHQRRLIPRIATAYASTFAHDEFLREFDAVFSGEGDTPERRADLETLAAALKPTSTWQGMDTLQTAREACGGAGYLAENRLTLLRHDLDVYTTFEGDNTVLLQLVGKRLLDDYAAKFKDADARESARLVVAQAASRAFRDIGLARLGGAAYDFGSSARSVGWIRRPENQRALLAARVEEPISEIAMALNRASKQPGRAAAVFNALQDKLITTAGAYGELIQWEAFTRKLEEFEPESETHRILTWLRDLFGLSLIERDLSWYLMSGRLTNKRARLVSSYIARLVGRLRPHAQSLVDAFGYTDAHLRAKIASGAERERQEEAAAYYERLRASGDLPEDERAVYRAKRKQAKQSKR